MSTFKVIFKSIFKVTSAVDTGYEISDQLICTQ